MFEPETLTNESDDSTAERPSFSLRGRIAIFAALAVGFAAFDLIWIPLTSLTPLLILFVVSPIVSALIAVQSDLIALGAALALGRMVIRLPAAGLALTATYVLVTTGSSIYWDTFIHHGMGAALAVNLVASWLGSFLTLLAFGVVTRRRLVLRGDASGYSSQFRLSDLSIGLTLIGVTLALLNIYGIPGDYEQLLDGRLLLHWSIMIVLSQALTLAALAAAFLWTGAWGLRMLVLAGLGIVMASLQIVANYLFYGSSAAGSITGLVTSTLFSVSHGIGTLAAFSLIRSMGYELRQVDRRAAPPMAKTKEVIEADPWTEED